MEVSQPTAEEALLDMALFVDLDQELSSDDLTVAQDFFTDTMLDDELLQSLITSTLSTDEHTTTRPLTVAAKSSRYRNRRREELELLRNTVKTLEVRLAALKARPTQHGNTHVNERATLTCSRIWEALALKESQQRQQAESKNKELRETVEMHVQLAQKLDQVLQRVATHVNTMEIT